MEYDVKGAIELMKERGYNHTATNRAGTMLFFLKQRDPKIHIHATVFIELQKVDLDNTALLSLGVTMYCESVPLDSKKFEDFENTLYNYTYLCVYGQHCDSIQESGRSGNDRMVQPDGSEGQSKTSGGGKSTGGVEKGKGKPSKPIKERKSEFWELIKQHGKEKGYEKDMCVAFYNYWKEMNPGGKKMRFEMEKIFDISRRLSTWLQNDKKWLPIWKQKEKQKLE